MHTSSGTTQSVLNTRSKLALGASAALVTYYTWRLQADGQRIALDSIPTKSPAKPATTPRTTKQSKVDDTPPTPPESEFTPDAPEPTDQTHGTTEKGGGTKREGEGEASSTPSEGQGETEGASDGGAGGAYNPETGEINWDCPCLGGMAHGPCGPEFREAFSCFIYSEEEPKGINCVEKFKGMQDCFRRHPEVYAEEIMDDDDDDAEPPVESSSSSSASAEESEPPVPAVIEKKEAEAQETMSPPSEKAPRKPKKAKKTTTPTPTEEKN